MDGGEATERALQPEDLDRLFLERANAGDVDGVVDLYEPDAVLAFPPGHLAAGRHVAVADRPAGRLGVDVEVHPGHRPTSLATPDRAANPAPNTCPRYIPAPL